MWKHVYRVERPSLYLHQQLQVARLRSRIADGMASGSKQNDIHHPGCIPQWEAGDDDNDGRIGYEVLNSMSSVSPAKNNVFNSVNLGMTLRLHGFKEVALTSVRA